MREKKPKLSRKERRQLKRERAYTQSMPKKVIKTTLDGVIAIALVGTLVVGNGALKSNDRIVNSVMGGISKTIDNSGSAAVAEGLNLNYNESEFSSEEELSAAQLELSNAVAEEGIVLLQNNDNALPVSSDTTFSIFSVNASKITLGASIMESMMGGGSDLKEAFEEAGVSVNTTLWDFYTSKDISGYGLASGSVSYGDAEDFRINECPLSELESAGVLDSAKGTTPVYLLKRVAGEGRDMPRSMYNHADNEEDQAKSYLEPDSTELEILQYLNDNYDNTVLVVNSNAALELDFLQNFPNIKSVIYAPDGLQALPNILTGKVNPSGRTVDTFAADALASPAAQNFGDYQYSDESGELTKYNYVSYEEGIYVGYRYYETRYEDAVLEQGNAGDFDYDQEVVYPFGYGLSYTDFEWSNYSVTWNGTEATVSVDVTNTGDVAGKDVVEIYVQSPYTDYDKENGIEKASVELVTYGKTSELQPGETQTVTTTFDQELLKVYDSNGAGTYILDAGTYYITASENAHDAVEDILAVKQGTADETTLVAEYVPDNTEVDTTTYSTDSYSGAEITNLFDDAAGDVTYLTRSDWTGTFPTHDGEASAQISTWGNEINGEDGASYTYTKTASDELLAELDSFDSGNPTDESELNTEIVYGADNGLTLIQMRGLDYDDPLWDSLLDQLTADDYWLTIEEGGYGTEFLQSVNKPFDIDADTAAGLMYGGAGDHGTFPNPMTLAQTFNKDLALRYGELIGEAALVAGEKGADGWYAPSMNIHRTPFSGRNGEYYSEDPLVSGITASQEVYGAASKGMYTFIKHFAFNDQEDHRGDRAGQYSVATWLNEQSAREIYLLPFEMCMKVGDVDMNYIKTNEDGTFEEATKQIRACQAVMTAFNRIGSTWTGGSYNLITGILRNEWAFNGFVITDNANTGVFMNSQQMIAAGGDAKLTYGGNEVRTDWDSTSISDYTYGREAMHRILYTIANSKAMNDVAPDGVFKDSMMLSEKLIVGLGAVFALIIAGLGVRVVKRFKKPASMK